MVKTCPQSSYRVVVKLHRHLVPGVVYYGSCLLATQVDAAVEGFFIVLQLAEVLRTVGAGEAAYGNDANEPKSNKTASV